MSDSTSWYLPGKRVYTNSDFPHSPLGFETPNFDGFHTAFSAAAKSGISALSERGPDY